MSDPADLELKDRLEQLGKLADDRWREYTNKTDAEWKASFGIWLPLTAAIGGLFAVPDARQFAVAHAAPIKIAAVVLGLCHLAFLAWIQFKLAELRPAMKAIYDERSRLLRVTPAQLQSTWPGSPLFQITLTVALLVLITNLV